MNYVLNTEADLTLSLTVWDERLGLTYDIDHEVYNVPVEGRETRTPATYFDPPESDGEAWVELDASGLMEMIEEQADGWFEDEGLVLLESPEEILSIAQEVANEWAADSGDWDVDDGYDG